jgi:hypothetical protein
MNKKILYGIFFVSIFLLSTAASVQPVQGYTWGVPKEAVGVTSHGEVKLYDEDEWEKHFGTDGAKPQDLFGGDADDVGAQSQDKYLEVETDEKLIAFLEDYLLANELPESVAAGLGTTATLDYKAVMDIVDWLLLALANDTASKVALYTKYGIQAGELITLFELGFGMIYSGYAGVGLPWDTALYNAYIAASTTQDYAEQGSLSSADVLGIWGKKYDGSILTRDKWDFDKDKEFKADKPDTKKDEVPFMADPRNWYESYLALPGYQYDITYRMNRLKAQAVNAWSAFNSTLAIVAPAGLGQWDPIAPVYPGHPYKTANDTIAVLEPALIAYGVPRNLTAINPNIPAGANNGVYTDIPYGIYLVVQGIIAGVEQIMDGILFGKQGTFWALMIAGLPTYVPQGDFLARVLKEFRFSDKDIEYNVYCLPLGVGVTLDISLDGNDIVIDFEYDPEDPLDPTDPTETDPDELEDFTAIFRYGDTGSQSEVIFMAGGTEFYKKGGVDQIPGFEISIILGVSAISIIGLIYVIMKKRKM